MYIVWFCYQYRSLQKSQELFMDKVDDTQSQIRIAHKSRDLIKFCGGPIRKPLMVYEEL